MTLCDSSIIIKMIMILNVLLAVNWWILKLFHPHQCILNRILNTHHPSTSRFLFGNEIALTSWTCPPALVPCTVCPHPMHTVVIKRVITSSSTIYFCMEQQMHSFWRTCELQLLVHTKLNHWTSVIRLLSYYYIPTTSVSACYRMFSHILHK